MEHLSRRHALRLIGGAAGAGVTGSATFTAVGALAPAAALGPRRPGTSIKRVLRRGTPLIGMSAPADEWALRCREVGDGLTARRIFADLASGPSSQLRLVEEAHAAGQLPVISYKVGGDVDGAVAGRFNKVARQAAAKLAAYDKPTAVTFWHEPYGDMSPAEYVAASKQILPEFKRGKLRVGPLLNGWLLDRQVSTFASYAPAGMFSIWDWFGLDTYESGTMEQPGDSKPASRVTAARRFLRSRGHRHPIGIGEYNGFSGKTIGAVGEALLSTKDVWFGCMWNSNGSGKGYVLEGGRLKAFQETLADPRSAAPRA
jgi:hypothetical protein